MTTMTHDSTRTAGLGFAMASAASFGLSGSLARGLMDVGWSSPAAGSVRILLAAVALGALAVVQGCGRGRWCAGPGWASAGARDGVVGVLVGCLSRGWPCWAE